MSNRRMDLFRCWMDGHLNCFRLLHRHARAAENHLHGQGGAIDVGAFAGYHTLRLARLVGTFDVYAFEGRASMKWVIEKNLQRNSATNVHIVLDTINKVWKPNQEIIDTFLGNKKENIEPKQPLSFIKIDCEGCELRFLKGMKNIIDKWRPAMVIEIQDDHTRNSIVPSKNGGQQMLRAFGSENQVMKYIKDVLGYTMYQMKNDQGVLVWDYECVYTNK